MNEKNETKVCNYCKTEINKDASVCPQCRRGQNRVYMVAAILAIALISFLFGRNAGRSAMEEEILAAQNQVAVDMETTDRVEGTVVEEEKVVVQEDEAENVEKVEEIFETEVQENPSEEMMLEMAELIKESSLKAEYKYKDKRVTITGTISEIASDHIYLHENSCFMSCDFQNEEQIYKALNYEKGDSITITGIVTDVSGCWYDIDIEQIHSN